MYVADLSWTKVAAADLHAAGYRGVIGYRSYDTTGKNMTAADVAGYQAAGLAVGVVWETYGQAASGGAAVGHREATDFVAQLQALGATGGTVWMVAEDPTQQPAGDYPNIDAYFAAAAPIVTAAGFALGAYGSEPYLNHLVAVNPQVTRRWFVGGWSQDSAADLVQQADNPGASTFGGACDCNYAPRPDWGRTDFGPRQGGFMPALTDDEQRELLNGMRTLTVNVDQSPGGVGWAVNQILLDDRDLMALVRQIAEQIAKAAPGPLSALSAADVQAVATAVLDGLRAKPLAPIS